MVVLLSLILGVVGISWAGLYLTFVGELAGKELAGTVTGMAATVSIIGSITGPPVFGHLVDITGSYKIAWQLLAILAILAAALLIFVREEKRRI